MSDSFTGQQINASIIRLTAAQWAAQSYVLPVGVIGIESDTGASKVGDGRTAWADLAYWNPSGGPKVYRALLTQTGTDAPVATVLENTLGETVVWTRGLTGIYFGTLAGAFPSGKTYVSPFQYVDPSNGNYQLYRYDDDAVTIESLTGVDLSDSLFAAYFPVPIQILVNP